MAGVSSRDFGRWFLWARSLALQDNRPPNGSLGSIGVIGIEQVRRPPNEALFNSLMDQYHYLGYEQPVGEHLKYLVRGANG